MSDENEALINLPQGGVPQSKDDDMFNELSSSGGFLPRLQLMTSNSEKCKGGEFPVNSYALIRGQDYTDLGKEVDLIIIAWRPKAIEMGEEVMAVYDIDDAEFLRIKDAADTPNSGCMFGPEFLVWNDKIGFASFFMGSKSARRESGTMRSLIGKAGTLKSRLIKTTKYSWQAPLVTPCSSFPTDKRPEETELQEEFEKFKNPPKSDVETVDNAESTGNREV